MRGHRLDVVRKQVRNWGLLFVLLVLCVEFWTVVTTTVAQNL